MSSPVPSVIRRLTAPRDAVACTKHFLHRAATRGLRPEVLGFIVAYGVEYEGAGARFLTVLDRALPPGLDHRLVDRARDWIVVFSPDGAAITCYRRREAVRYVARRARRTA